MGSWPRCVRFVRNPLNAVVPPVAMKIQGTCSIRLYAYVYLAVRQSTGLVTLHFADSIAAVVQLILFSGNAALLWQWKS